MSLGGRERRRTIILLATSATIISVCMGLRQSLGLFLQPMTLEIGISVSAFSVALALQSIVWGGAQPVIGMLADRYGAAPVLMAMALVYAAGLALMSIAQSPLALDVGGGVLVGMGVAGCGFGVLVAVVNRAVPPERRSQAVGTVAALGSLGTFILPSVGQAAISAYDWRWALVLYAVIALTMALLAIVIARAPAAVPLGSAAASGERGLGETLATAFRHGGYLAMTAAFFACGFQLVFITTHLPSYLAFCGLPPAVSATALGVIGLCNTLGTYIVGLLGARYPQKRLLALVYLIRTISIAAYLAIPVTTQSTLVFAAAMGLLWLSVAPLVSGLIARIFGLRHFSTLYGVVFFSHQLGSFCGALLGGIVFDLTGAYGAAWLALIAIGLIAFTLQWLMDDRPPEERERTIPRAAPEPA